MDNKPTYEELEELIRQLKESQGYNESYEKRMERNRIIGSIGHEFNNLLMGIQGNLSLIFLDMNQTDKLFTKLKDIEKNVEGGVKITEKLFDFLNEGVYEPNLKYKEIPLTNINRLKSEIKKTINSQLIKNTYGPPGIQALKVYEKVYSGSNTVLMVDDDSMIIDVGKQMLERTGIEVIVAKSGQRALDIYIKDYKKIDMVILDLIMPGMNGIETYHELKKINPEIKVLFSSGYRKNLDVDAIIREGRSSFIQKPFKMEQLTQEIGRILEM
ncbi:MAG: response regulator [Proteobacteria bacterium]|nr:response regulator [Pseudomonadota bacterium]